MTTFVESTWGELMSLIEIDDGDGIFARAFELQESGVLEWSHPKDELNRTPVMIAYWYDHLKAAAGLVRAGADYQRKDSRGRNVTWYAQNFGKGTNEGAMSLRIAVTTRRLSMESVIRGSNGPASDSGATPPKPRKRSNGV